MTEARPEKQTKKQARQGKIKVNFFIRKSTDGCISKYSDKLRIRKSELLDLVLGDDELLAAAMQKHITAMQESMLE
jgi:hypothetical protein